MRYIAFQGGDGGYDGIARDKAYTKKKHKYKDTKIESLTVPLRGRFNTKCLAFIMSPYY